VVVVIVGSIKMELEEEEEESRGELRERFKASSSGEESIGEEEEEDEGPKIRRSLSSEGVRGIEISLFSGSGANTGDGLIIGLRYEGSRGSFSIGKLRMFFSESSCVIIILYHQIYIYIYI
jgi:hypothetical protein